MGLGLAITVGGSSDRELSTSAASVEVYERMGETTTYTIRYPIDIADGDLPFLRDSRVGPGSELGIFAEAGKGAACLVKGPVYGQQIRLVHGGAGSYCDLQGADTSIAMDRETRAAQWSDVTDSDAVSTILSRYGYTADVESTKASHAEAKHTLVQRESDLRFVRRLARRNGFQFWITCDGDGKETAHFRRPKVDGQSAHDLKLNLDSPSVEVVELSWDVERPTSVVGAQLDVHEKSDIDGAVAQSPLGAMAARRLSAVAEGTRSVHVAALADDAGDLRRRGEGALCEADFFVRASCRTTVNAVGAVARACTIVNLRGAGKRHSGNYLVAGVRHVFDSIAHRMEIELIRNAWGT
jgi:hypothetical protein